MIFKLGFRLADSRDSSQSESSLEDCCWIDRLFIALTTNKTTDLNPKISESISNLFRIEILENT